MPSTPPSPRKTDAHDKEEDIDLENAVEDPLLSLPVSSSTTSPLPLSSELPSDAPPPPPSSRFLFDIGLGQVLSLLITATGIFSSLLAESGRSIPATQACLTYFILSFHLCRLPRGEPLKVAWWKYLLLAAIDLEGNYLVRFHGGRHDIGRAGSARGDIVGGCQRLRRRERPPRPCGVDACCHSALCSLFSRVLPSAPGGSFVSIHLHHLRPPA